MSFGFVPFSGAAFADQGVSVSNVTITAAGQSIAASVSNNYSVEGTHHVEGVSIASSQGNEAIVLSQIPTSSAITSAVNSVTVTGTANLTLTGQTATTTLGSPDPQLVFTPATSTISTTINSVSASTDVIVSPPTNAIASAVNSVLPK